MPPVKTAENRCKRRQQAYVMKVGILNDHFEGLPPGYLQRYEEILKFNGIECVWLEPSDQDLWQAISELDLFIYQWGHYDGPRHMAGIIIPIVQYEMKIPCFPNWETSWHYDDKIKQYYLLRQHGFPIIESYIFWEEDEALRWLKSAQMPVVFKLKGGAGSSNVILVANRPNAQRLVSRMFGKGLSSGSVIDRNSLRVKYFNPYKELRRFVGKILTRMRGEYQPLFWQVDKNYALFQKYLPNNSFDTRVSVIGERAFAFRRFNRNDDFRASGSGNIDYDTTKIDPRAIDIAFRISQKLNFQSMGYDFLINQTGDLEISEISYTYVDTAVYKCPGFWDKNLNWHEGHFWPQYFQLVDALKRPDLMPPQP